ncbi:GLUG motif-containing protein, partial [Aliarcobacter butzleri]
IDAGVTSSWNSGAGFNPISIFTGTFDGKGFTISDLYINRNMDFVGLFGYTSGSTIKNLGLVNVNITGSQNVGGLVGMNSNNSQIENSYVTGNVSGGDYSYNIGGFVGYNNNSQIKNSYFTGSVTGSQNVGGLVGMNSNNSQIENSYALGSVGGFWYVGGLVGWNDNYSKIENSYVNGNVNGNNSVGGLVGLNYNNSQIKNSYVSGNVNGNNSVGGLLGWNEGTITNSWYDNETNSASMADSGYGILKNNIVIALKNASSEWETDSSKGRGYGIDGLTALPFLKNVTKLSNTLFQDGLGTSAKPYTITNWTQLQNINNSNILTKNYYFNLLNDLSNQTSDYTNLASSTANGGLGWDSIGYNSSNAFNGVFDGKGFTISDLYINRPNQDYIGLFGITNSGVKNLGLVDVDITGKHQVGGLVGYYSYGGTIENSYFTGTVTGDTNIGGLVGFNGGGTIINSYFSGNVTGSSQVGGLSGLHQGGTIENSYAIGEVRGNDYVGGLVGRHYLGTVKNSYASGLVSGNSNIGGLIGYSDNGTIQNSFYDKTKNPNFDNGLGIGKTTQELSYGGTFKNASWDIIADSSVTSFTPIRKWDRVNNKYIWAVSPLALNYNLGSKSTTYNGSVQNLSDFYSSVIVIPSGYQFLNIDYKFQKDENDVTGYKNAGIYSNIKVALNGTSATDEFLTLSTTGNITGTLTITPTSVIPNKVVQNSEVQKVINSIQRSISTQSLSNILSSVNNSTADTQIQEQQNSIFLNTTQNIQTLALGKDLGISIVNGGVNAPSINIEEIKNLLSTQN